jgi:hypothetical protein
MDFVDIMFDYWKLKSRRISRIDFKKSDSIDIDLLIRNLNDDFDDLDKMFHELITLFDKTTIQLINKMEVKNNGEATEQNQTSRQDTQG